MYFEICAKTIIFERTQCKRLIARHALLFELNVEMRVAVQLQNWTRNVTLNRERLQKQNVAATKIQAAARGFLLRKRLPRLKYEIQTHKQVRAAVLIQVKVFKFFFFNARTRRAPIVCGVRLVKSFGFYSPYGEVIVYGSGISANVKRFEWPQKVA